MGIEVYEVQSAALGHGVYNCKKQQLLASGWQAGAGDKFEDYDETIIQVLNVIENDTLADYTPALAKGDRISAGEFRDCDGLVFRIGFPATPSVRMARTTKAAGEAQQITCNLMGNNGNEITTGLGSGIEVYFKPTNDADINAALPRLADDDYLFVQNIAGKWWCVTVLQASKDCVCSS